ncbi:PRC-barrel domain containing protein [Halorussus gelatinilyticus]|uniref:PRC-barrel domain containing protein n=1 Tax=Halorussus gelatinilyticus TaxID=2937524 RepID=A0A8U0IG79_9EURY|nr:PRC-barrel domain containing protein [Halorussus gelatinilyticus]UPV99058.1 PRC-barrel domain containing protein [Halorussus gelatinilyticus]
MTVAITEDDVDKTVVDAEGQKVGTVTEIHHGAARVSADEETVEEMQTRLPQGGIDERTYAVHDESVADITEDRLVLDVEA